MKALQHFIESKKGLFETGGKLEKLYPVYEALDTFAFTPAETAEGRTHLRDALDLKRTMILVVMALTPCIFMAFYNTGLQAILAMEETGLAPQTWRADVMEFLGLALTSDSFLSSFLYGGLFFLPVYFVTVAVGGLWEALFATVRKHEINEGFLVTSMLFPLTLPPSIPLWQVAVGISFGVVIAKEVFGGTGRNIFNPALSSRVFLFFAYPAQISGDSVWVGLDGYSSATALSQAAVGGSEAITTSWWNAFLGFIPGSMGETSTLAALIGAVILIVTGIGSWRIMLSGLIGLLAMGFIFQAIGSETNLLFGVSPWTHLVLGSFAFAIVFMATDPVSASMTETGAWVYGFCIGALGMIVRVANPAYPEGWMLAILFMNAFAPLIDYFVVNANVKRRLARNGI